MTESLLSDGTDRSPPPSLSLSPEADEPNKKRYIRVEEKNGKVVGLAAAMLKGNNKPAEGLEVKEALKYN
jgi:hypothetical protein